MSLTCPVCHSLNLLPQRCGERIGSTIGASAGAVAGLSTSLTDGNNEKRAGPATGLVLATLTNAFMGGRAGSAAGGTTVSRIGNMVDAKVLGTYRCADCNYTFSS